MQLYHSSSLFLKIRNVYEDYQGFIYISINKFRYNYNQPLYFSFVSDIKIIIHRPIRKMFAILFSPEINFSQSNHCRLVEYFKNDNSAKYEYRILCILFEKLDLKKYGNLSWI